MPMPSFLSSSKICRCFKWPGTGWSMQGAGSQSLTGKPINQNLSHSLHAKIRSDHNLTQMIMIRFMPWQDQESACVPVHHTRPETGLATAAAAEPATAAATTTESATAAAGGDCWTSSAAADTNLHLALTQIILMHCPMYFYLADM